MNRIIYQNKDLTVAVLVPAQEVLDTVGLASISEKDDTSFSSEISK